MFASSVRKASFSLGYIDDIKQLESLWRLDGEAYGDANLDFDRFVQWWERYEQGLTIVRFQEEIVAAFGLWGISRDQARLFLAGQIAEKDLEPLSERQLPTPFWYWSGIVMKPEFRQSLFSPLRLLLRTGVSSWLGSEALTYHPHAYIYALGMSEQGLDLLNRFDFEKIREPEETPDRFPLFVQEFSGYGEAQSMLRERLG